MKITINENDMTIKHNDVEIVITSLKNEEKIEMAAGGAMMDLSTGNGKPVHFMMGRKNLKSLGLKIPVVAEGPRTENEKYKDSFPGDGLITVPDAAKKLGKENSWVYSQLNKGLFTKSVRIGSFSYKKKKSGHHSKGMAVMVSEKEIDAYINNFGKAVVKPKRGTYNPMKISKKDRMLISEASTMFNIKHGKIYYDINHGNINSESISRNGKGSISHVSRKELMKFYAKS